MRRASPLRHASPLRRASPLLRAAPLRAVRQPALGAGLALAAAVLALATAGTPLYRVAVGNAAVAGAVEGFHEDSLGLTVGSYASLHAEVFASTDGLLRGEGAAAGLPAPFATLRAEADAVPAGVDPFAPTRAPTGGDGEPPPAPLTRPIQFFARDGVTGHLPEPQPCPEDAGGVWVSRRLAAAFDLEPCGTLRVAGHERQAGVRVAGVYRDLLDVLDTRVWDAPDPLPEGSPIARYWQRLGESVVRLSADGTPVPQPPLVVAEPHDLAGLGVTSAAGIRVQQHWTFPFPLEGAWYAQVRETAERYRDFVAEARRVDRPVGEALVALTGQPVAVQTTTLLPAVADRTDAVVAAVGAAMQPLGVAGQAAAVLVVAAAGVFEGRRRRSERALLAAQGIGPAGTAGRAALEALLPVALGTAAGTAAAAALVRAVAPGQPPDAALVAELLPGVAAWAAVAVLLLAVTAAAQASGPQQPAVLAAGGWLRRHPWEVVPLLLAAASYWTLRVRGEVLAGSGPQAGGPAIDLSYVLFPFLLLVACGGFAGRVPPRAGRALRRLAPAAPASLYLAARRLAAAPPAASLLVAVTAVGIGVLVYAFAVSASTEQTASTTVEVVHGAPTVADLSGRGELEGLPPGVTVTARIQATVHPAGTDVDLLTVDPETFAGVAFWQDRFADRPLDELVAALDRRGGDALPVLLVGTPPGERPSLETSRYRVPVEVVARPAAFPGMSGQRPLAVAATGTLVEVVAASGQSTIDEALMLSRSRALWTVHEPDELPGLLAGQPVEAGVATTVTQVRHDRPHLLAASWALGYLQGVGATAGLLGLVALVLYLYGQQRSRAVAFALLNRMGLSRRQHRRAVTVEIGALVGAALVAGALPAGVAAWLVVVSVDILPRVGPPPQLVAPWPLAGILVALACALCLAAARASQRAADRTAPGELLRGAD